jgi:acyl carrier protein
MSAPVAAPRSPEPKQFVEPSGVPKGLEKASPRASPGTGTEREAVANRVRRVVEKQLGKKGVADSVTYASLGADDLDRAKLVMALEEEFELEIPDRDADRLMRLTVGDTVSYLLARLRGKQPAPTTKR